MSQIKKIPLASITCEEGHSEGKSALAQSMADLGLFSPVTVTPKENGFTIVPGLGRDRYRAAVELGWTDIDAVVLPSGTPEEALRLELRSIDESLCRREISPAERAWLTARRKEIYEQLHPETKRGTAGGKARQGKKADVPSFVEDHGAATGQAPRTISKHQRRGAALGEETLRKLRGTSLDAGPELDALLELPEDRRQQVIDRAVAGDKVSARTALKQEERRLREIAVAGKILSIPDELAGVLYVDVPWKTINWSVDTGSDRAAENHYVTMTLEQIQQFPIDKFAAADCYLFFWTTGPFWSHALRVIEDYWHFEYVTRISWMKMKRGTGRVVIDKSEDLIIAKRGTPVAPARGLQPESVQDIPEGGDLADVFTAGGHIEVKRTGHSEKPIQFAALIEKHWPNTPKRELFARGATPPGWLPKWGHEADPVSSEDVAAESMDDEGESHDSEGFDGDAQDASDAVEDSAHGGAVRDGVDDRDGSDDLGVQAAPPAAEKAESEEADPFAALNFQRSARPKPANPDDFKINPKTGLLIGSEMPAFLRRSK